MSDYDDFLGRKAQLGAENGFEPEWEPAALFPFQRALLGWAQRKGRGLVAADCGLGKTPMQLAWAENVVRKTNRSVLVLTPLAVAQQTVREADKFGIEARRSAGALEPGAHVVVTNYEKLHHFRPDDFGGVVLDESSCIKAFDGRRRAEVTEFMRTIPYRTLWTATAAPNDYIELGTASEALGVMERKHMLAQFFTHDGGETSTWRLKGHTRAHLFWRWMCSWARACRRPSDLGFDDDGFVLPPLSVKQYVVTANRPRTGFLFDVPAVGLDEQREDLRRTLRERCEKAAELVNAHDMPAVCWTNLNAEADLLERLIHGAVNVQGSDSDERKEEAFNAFSDGSVRVIVSKATIAGFGLNWQHCAHMTFFPSHSYEQYYQSLRRCWRFGQTRPVVVDLITTDGQQGVLESLERKSDEADRMFGELVRLMNDEMVMARAPRPKVSTEVPSWV